MRSNSVVKCLIFLTIAVLTFIWFKFITATSFYQIKSLNGVQNENDKFEIRHSDLGQAKPKLFYILQWTSPNNVPFVYMGQGRQGFIDRKCPYTNCYVTSNRTLLGNYTKFDVIAFAGPEVRRYSNNQLPQYRSPHQKYAFASIESAYNYPLCSKRFDGYFNWTWTYKLDSDSRWGYVVVRDNNGFIVGPNEQMFWKPYDQMLPTPDGLKVVLKRKTKLVAWFVSNCATPSHREDFVRKFSKELYKYNYTVDIYGKCGSLRCSRDNETICDEMIRRDYKFYLALENSFSEDYVTEKLIHAVGYNAIPIVYGGADYSRFLPEHSYLNARELTVEELVEKIKELENFDAYSDYFRWTRYYSYHRRAHSVETDDYCGFCTLLNDKNKFETRNVYQEFQAWWDPPSWKTRCKY